MSPERVAPVPVEHGSGAGVGGGGLLELGQELLIQHWYWIRKGWPFPERVR